MADKSASPRAHYNYLTHLIGRALPALPCVCPSRSYWQSAAENNFDKIQCTSKCPLPISISLHPSTPLHTEDPPTQRALGQVNEPKSSVTIFKVPLKPHSHVLLGLGPVRAEFSARAARGVGQVSGGGVGGASDGSRHWKPSQASAASKWNKQTIISMYISSKLLSINFKYFATLF